MFDRGRCFGKSARQMIYEQRNAQRMAQCDMERFMEMKSNLQKLLGVYFKRENVLAIARKTARRFGLTIDSGSSRKFEPLILWVFERFDEIGDCFVQNAFEFLENPERFIAEEKHRVPYTHIFNGINQEEYIRATTPGIEMNEPGLAECASSINITGHFGDDVDLFGQFEDDVSQFGQFDWNVNSHNLDEDLQPSFEQDFYF